MFGKDRPYKAYSVAGLTYWVAPGGQAVARCPDCGEIHLVKLREYLVMSTAEKANKACRTCGQVLFPVHEEDAHAWAPCVDAWQRGQSAEIVAQKKMRVLAGRLTQAPYTELRAVLGKRYPDLAAVCGWQGSVPPDLKDAKRTVDARQGVRSRENAKRYGVDVLRRLDHEMQTRLALFAMLLELDHRNKQGKLYTEEGKAVLAACDRLTQALDGTLTLPPDQNPLDLVPDSIAKIAGGVALAAGQKVGELVGQRVAADVDPRGNL